jgi:hypothetical protein
LLASVAGLRHIFSAVLFLSICLLTLSAMRPILKLVLLMTPEPNEMMRMRSSFASSCQSRPGRPTR